MRDSTGQRRNRYGITRYWMIDPIWSDSCPAQVEISKLTMTGFAVEVPLCTWQQSQSAIDTSSSLLFGWMCDLTAEGKRNPEAVAAVRGPCLSACLPAANKSTLPYQRKVSINQPRQHDVTRHFDHWHLTFHCLSSALYPRHHCMAPMLVLPRSIQLIAEPLLAVLPSTSSHP